MDGPPPDASVIEVTACFDLITRYADAIGAVPHSEMGLTPEQAIAHEGRFFELGYADDYGAGVQEGWQRVHDAILETPGALEPAVRRAIYEGDDPPELAPLLDKVRRHAYRITDRDIEGLDADVVIEAALAAALGEALRARERALEALA
ncbi:MAG TPA: hypothetical protein VIK66_09485 [Gaiellaceae bacterium]